MKNPCSLLVLAFGLASLAGAASAQPAPASPQWQQVAPGVWKATIGQAESFTLLNAAGIEPRTEALQAMPAAAFPIDQSEVEARVINGKTMLRFPLALD